MLEKAPQHLERYHGLDAVRALAMLMIITLHVAVVFSLNCPPLWRPDRVHNEFFDYLVIVLQTAALPAFFLISGFFARQTFNRRGPAGFARHRARHILVPF